jgi:ADP-ribose pyrophosphatase YjhB (NUDIX family)
VRPTARVLLVDDRDRALLFSSVSEDDGCTFWYPPGGGLEAGETYELAAVREVLEETGLKVDVGAVLAHRRDVRTLAGTTYDFVERWFLVRVPTTIIDTAGFTELERSTIEEHRWWSVDELRATTDRLTPTMLADLLAQLLRDGPPAEPWQLGR